MNSVLNNDTLSDYNDINKILFECDGIRLIGLHRSLRSSSKTLFGRSSKMRQLTTSLPKIAALFAILLLGISIALFAPNLAFASEFPENDGLTEQEVRERFREIRTSYDVGEEFSASDADFVLRYAVDPSKPAARGSSAFQKTGSLGGTSATMSGTLYHNGTFSYTYGANATISVSGPTPKNLVFTVHCTSYGVVGSGGVGIIYDGEVSATKSNSSYFQANPSRTYSGVMTLYSVECVLDVTTSRGSFLTVTA